LPKLNVLILTDADVFAGTERHIFDLAVALLEAGVEPTIGCPESSPLAEAAASENLPILQVGVSGQPKGGRADWATLRRLRSAFRRNAFSVVHVHNGRSAFIAALAGAGKRLPMVMTQHFLSPARTTRKGVRGVCSKLAHGWLESRISRHIAISQAVRSASISAGIADPAKIQVVLNGIRKPQRVDSNAVLEANSWFADGSPRIFCAARAEPEKDLATLVAAMQELRVSVPNARCVIAGGGQQLESLREMAAKPINDGSCLQEPNVQLLGFRQDVANWMSAADIFVLPSPAEPFGLVLLEAMAVGKPIVACAAGGPCEIVDSGQTGFLVPPKSPSAMAEALATLAADPNLRQSMGQAGYRRYQEMFTAKTMAEQIAGIYQEVLSGK
jgi:glycosyltransferase involved in cell wall biosynthesis